MKIALVIPASSEALFDKTSQQVFGGANVQMYQLAKEFGRYEGVVCHTLIEDYQTVDFDEQECFNLIKTYRKTDHVLVKFWKYHRVLRSIRPDAILQHGLTFFSALLAVYCKVFAIRFVYMFAHDNEAEGRYQESSRQSPVFGLLLACAHVLIAQNIYQQEKLRERYGKEARIVRNGFYLKPFPEKKNGRILWVARHSSWKRPELFIQLAAQNPHLQFQMVCPPSMAANYEQLAGMAEEVANLEFIRFVPFAEIDDYFTRARVFVNTSDYEGFPQTFIQAAMNGLPILSLRVNPDHILTENYFGFCCDGRMQTLYEKLNLLCTDQDLYQTMARNAFDYAQENHDIVKNVRTILDLVNN